MTPLFSVIGTHKNNSNICVINTGSRCEIYMYDFSMYDKQSVQRSEKR